MLQSMLRIKLSSKLIINVTNLEGKLLSETSLSLDSYISYIEERISTQLFLRSCRQPQKYKDGPINTLYESWLDRTGFLKNSDLVEKLKMIPGLLIQGTRSTTRFRKQDLKLFTAMTCVGSDRTNPKQFFILLKDLADKRFCHINSFKSISDYRCRLMYLFFNHIFLAKNGHLSFTKHQENVLNLLKGKALLIQLIWRRYYSYIRHKRCKVLRRKLEKEKLYHLSCRTIQRLYRGYHSRHMVIKNMQMKWTKYNYPGHKKTIWRNTETMQVCFDCPIVLKTKIHCDTSIQFPSKGLEMKSICSFCQCRYASIECLECRDIFCAQCHTKSHTTGKRRTHGALRSQLNLFVIRYVSYKPKCVVSFTHFYLIL